jgi:hypothetical protein
MRKEKIPHQAPFAIQAAQLLEGRSVRASSLLRQNSSSVPLSLGRTRPCKTTASPVCWKGFVYNYRKPLIFDSFYVSILSEKNRNNPFGILNGLIIGLISNLFALFSTNYSSSFYVFSKD